MEAYPSFCDLAYLVEGSEREAFPSMERRTFLVEESADGEGQDRPEVEWSKATEARQRQPQADLQSPASQKTQKPVERASPAQMVPNG